MQVFAMPLNCTTGDDAFHQQNVREIKIEGIIWEGGWVKKHGARMVEGIRKKCVENENKAWTQSFELT